ncbi:hypothetical protein A3D03_01355 [Candidatus Gottesmanbacteria bacterium RIFCSPHIGHO2_02_FULL_40_13]|uniref:AI-2E family transporter n=1 Tax=Candidatus Gottesmanbacteria bacterium RIFCSPHIGHO2_02_FULL_40_13 TaxID=1798384 RepID=A0A1F6AAS8_9BACT|nr:MAG: hypothetical protein A3D03_01355 [Candidatus Gottesmanbacteria bacterium RIFCSPHIGHO2_02_FULL_40_13]
MNSSKIEISYKTILFTIFFLILLWFLVYIKDILFILLISLIIMSACKPLVDKLEKSRLPRIVAILAIYILGLITIVYLGGTLLPPLITESINLGQSLPNYLEKVIPFISVDTQFISQQIAPIGENLLKVTLGIFSNLFHIFTIFVVSFYLLIEREQLENHLAGFMGVKSAENLLIIIERVEERLGSWVRGQVTLALVIGIATYIGLLFLGLPFILPLSIIAGLLEIVPIIGPIISAIPAILVALTVSPILAAVTALVFVVIQQVENHFIVPYVLRKSVGLPPVITIITLMIGTKLAGVLGAMLSVPIVVMLETIIVEYSNIKSTQN